MNAFPRAAMRRSSMAAALLCATSCGLPSGQDMDLAQTVVELGQGYQELQQHQLDLQDRIDSLAGLVARQDSTIRMLANLLGSPLPPR
jgi:hypothetical protein